MDWMTREQRSRNMAAIRSKGNKSTEVALRFRMVRAGIRGWRTHARDLPGRPDFVFDALKLAVFVDGCYWHGCPKCGHIPSQNRPYWSRKIEGNQTRDKRVRARLRRQGWSVIRIWEHEIKYAPQKALKRLARKIGELRSLPGNDLH